MSADNNLTPLTRKMQELEQQGYKDKFKMTQDGLKALHADQVFQPHELKIVQHYRFEGASDPEDLSALYALESKGGVKGTLVTAYGPYCDEKISDFLQQVEDHNTEQL